MAEEQRCQIEGHRLCANNCGFFGKPATLNLCSKCYRNLHPDDDKSPLSTSSTSSPPSPSVTSPDPSPDSPAVRSPAEAVTAPRLKGASRCAGCKRKVGITGFRCRCGSTFCGTHRYPEKHACGYDYKADGRKEIARANPVIKAEKLRKI